MSASKFVLSFVLSAGLLMTAGSASAAPLGIDIDIDLGGHHKTDNGSAAPELAGRGAPAALALIAAGAAIVISRRRRQS